MITSANNMTTVMEAVHVFSLYLVVLFVLVHYCIINFQAKVKTRELIASRDEDDKRSFSYISIELGAHMPWEVFELLTKFPRSCLVCTQLFCL